MKSTIQLKKDSVQKARARCLKKFLYYFRKGFSDTKYLEWERAYKVNAHFLFQTTLNRVAYEQLLLAGKYTEIAQQAARIESKTNLLFSFEKMALRDAIKSPAGAKAFTKGLFEYVYGKDNLQQRFEAFSEVLAALPRRQTRVLTWPLQTVFGFLANPDEHIFLKPRVTQTAAQKYQYNFNYQSSPNWNTYQSLIEFAESIRKDTRDYSPKDYIDLQSFIWVLGSDEYPD